MLLTEDNFRQLVFDVNARLVNYAGRYVPDRASACDIVQESWISLWNRYRGKVVYKAEALLYTIVRNKCLDFLKSACIFDNIPIDSIIEFCPADELLYRDLVSDLAGDVPLICRDLEKCIGEAISTLPPRCLEVFRMSRTDRKSNREIAVLLGISEKAVEKHITKALKILSSSLSSSGFNPVVLLLFS